jgi:hypothetical protein
MPFTPEDDLRLSIRMGLTKGLRLVRAMRRQLDEDDRNLVAEKLAFGFPGEAGWVEALTGFLAGASRTRSRHGRQAKVSADGRPPALRC